MLQDIRLPELEQSAKDVLYYHGCGWKNQRHVAIINTWLLYRDPLGAVKDQVLLGCATFTRITVDELLDLL